MSESHPGSSRTIADFDARASSWDEDPSKVERARAVAQAIVRELGLSSGMRALEYGAGTGLLSFLLRPHLGEITLADLSEGMLAVARRKIAAAGDDRMHAIKLDLLADPLPAQRFDLVYSLMTLHHIRDTAGILRRFRDVLVPSGAAAIADLDREDGAFHGEGFEGHLGFDRDALGALARDAGFARVRFTSPYAVRKMAGGAMREFPLFLMIAEA